MKSPYYIPELIEDGDILFNKNSDYLKQKKQEKKNPIFKRRTAKRRNVLAHKIIDKHG